MMLINIDKELKLKNKIDELEAKFAIHAGIIECENCDEVD